MTIEIVCPHCGFAKRVPREKIPAKARWATCPNCRQRFEFMPPPPDQPPLAPRPESVEDAGGQGRPSGGQAAPAGLLRGFMRTARAVLFSPSDFFGASPLAGGKKEPLAFGLLFGAVGGMLGVFWQFLLMRGRIADVAGPFLGQTTGVILFVGVIVMIPVLVIIGMYVASAVLHLSLLIVGGGKRGFEATFRVIAYSQSTELLLIVPFVGGLAGWFWQLGIRIIGLRAIHGTSYPRVIVAFLLPVLALGLITGAVVLLIAL